MKLRSVAIWAALGMVGTTAVAMAIPMSPSSSGSALVEPDDGPRAKPASDISHFSAGKTLTVDARLGHASVPAGGPAETYLFASVTGADTAQAGAPPLQLAIVIDRSGSMKGERLANAIAGSIGTVERMRDGDTVTVVTFDTEAQVIVPPTRTTSSTRGSIEAAIRSIRLGGDTCISCGLESAMTQLSASAPVGDHVTRMLLLSDGATNHGIKDLPGLRALAARMRDRGCSISTIGVDVDFDEKVMAAIATESNGRHYFVANASELPGVFSQEFDTLLSSVARESELAIDLAPGVEVEQVFDRTFRREGSRVVVPFGTFGAKQEKTVLLKLRVPADRDGVAQVASLKLSYRDLVERTNGACEGELALDVASDGGAQKDLDPYVAARLERSRTAETLTEANTLFEQGRFAEAKAKLAAQEDELQKTQTVATLAAGHAAKPKAASRSLDVDFDEQRNAVAAAESNFGAAAPAATTAPGGGAATGGGGGFANAAPAAQAPPPAPAQVRAGKATVRENQEKATTFGF